MASPLSRTTPVIKDVEYNDNTGWDPKINAGTPIFSNKISEIFSLFSSLLWRGSDINKGWFLICSSFTSSLEYI